MKLYNNPNSFENKLLDIYILIEENKAESTILAIDLFATLWQHETKEKINKKRANEEMLKAYNNYMNKK